MELNKIYNEDCHFNSIKVRLELNDDNVKPTEPHKFQFHKGTIRTRKI